MADELTIRKEVANLATSLIEDGYRRDFAVKLPDTYFMKLHHIKNGSRITLVGNYKKSCIMQFRNGKLTNTKTI